MSIWLLQQLRLIHEFVKKLKGAGFSESQAEAVAEAQRDSLAQALDSQLASPSYSTVRKRSSTLTGYVRHKNQEKLICVHLRVYRCFTPAGKYSESAKERRVIRGNCRSAGV